MAVQVWGHVWTAEETGKRRVRGNVGAGRWKGPRLITGVEGKDPVCVSVGPHFI